MSDEQTTPETDGTPLKVTTYNARHLMEAADLLDTLKMCMHRLSEIETLASSMREIGDELEEVVDGCFSDLKGPASRAEETLSREPTIVGFVVSNASDSYDQEEVFPTYDEALRYWEEGDAIGAVLSDNTVTFEI